MANSIIDTSAYVYETIRVRDKSGKLRHVRGANDAVTRALILHAIVNGKDRMQVARANKIEMGTHTNAGQAAMALGNKLRALVKSGTPVTIGSVVVKTLKQNVPLPLVKANENGRKAKPKARSKRSQAQESAAA